MEVAEERSMLSLKYAQISDLCYFSSEHLDLLITLSDQ